MVVSKATLYFSPAGKRLESRSSSACASAIHLKRIGVGELHHADAHRVMPVELQSSLP